MLYKAKIKLLEKTITKDLATLNSENTLLKNDRERMNSILNNTSSNSSKPPSSEVKPNKVNRFSGRVVIGKKAVGQKNRKGITLTKETIEVKIQSGEFEHEIIPVGTPSEKYETRYVIDYKIIPIDLGQVSTKS